ncbi:preprotein translocase subunit YajC [Actinomyces trachealis]|uniref:preprotein translocase subunit YajC n=1 Tax=Actinomyces trachealis TaxID=2763540 RepID=UPI00189299D4|nr:preprotein translocase subunit YajC [Actinomyces trachealis]
MDPMLIVMLVVMGGGFWLMTRVARRQQAKMQAEQDRRLQEALVPGTWVRTHSGFYGKFVEIDGDVVTLATPLGDESLWHKRALLGAEEPPFAVTTEAPAAADTAAETPVTKPAINDVSDQQA